MLDELEEKFFKSFNLGIPVVKCVEWDNGPFAHYDDWSFVERTFDELEFKNATVEKLNDLIEECKNNDPENVSHTGYHFSTGCYVKAYMKYPSITDRKLLELLLLVSDNLDMKDCRDIKELKERILRNLIANSSALAKFQGVCEIFREE